MINVAVNGAKGKMGEAICQAIEENRQLNLVAKLGRADDLHAGIVRSAAQVVVDTTAADVGFANAQTIIAANAHPVIVTSGFTQSQVEQLQQYCAKKKLGGIIAPNFSIGGVLMMQFAAQAAHYFKHVEIIERHHENKQEAPSGTALRTAEKINAMQNAIASIECQQLISGVRGGQHQNVAIHSVRLPGSVAHQEVLFGANGETLSIKHDSLDRQCFLPGIMLACQRVLELQALVFGLEHLLDYKK